MAKLDLTPEARVDLVEIDEWGFQQFGKEIVDGYSRGLHDAFNQLAEFPLSGSMQPELGRNICCLTHRKHRLFYAVERDTVLIIRIIHHARNARRELKQ